MLLKERLNSPYLESDSKERVRTFIFRESQEAISGIAGHIAEQIRSRSGKPDPFVLGLATGSTPKGLYRELIRLHRQEGLSFRNVVTFNLDEYYPMDPSEKQSYVRFMNEQLFDHIDIPKENINIPDGTLSKEQIETFCLAYEKEIERYGGLDLQILGIGRTGHIGFNEPGSSIHSGTRLVTLDNLTRMDASADFSGIENVPKKAITMGISTIMKAKEVILMAWGEGKAEIVRKAVEDPVTENIPASYLQQHKNTTFVLDEAAASALSKVKTPWLVGACKWDEALIRKAVAWLCQKVNKPILKLTDKDYSSYGMNELLTRYGSSYQLNIHLFNYFQHTITGWPGGKPDADDTSRPERALPKRKRVLIFSPHPDDDVISMGGTFIRLHEQGHEVHVAYQTSGDIAVFDHDVIRFMDFVKDFNAAFGFDIDQVGSLYYNAIEKIRSKRLDDIDDAMVRRIKALIRRSEAKAGCKSVGLTDDRAHFMNLPFYQTGSVDKKPVGEEDIKLTVDLLNEIRPHQIFAAGDLSDPHGTHRVCLDIIFKSIEQLKAEGCEWLKECYVWMYRGAWQEWDLNEIEMAVPLSPDEVLKKRRAIFMHQSQKDTPVFPGNDPREFWQRAEDRNRETARLYDQMGLPEYAAIEAFKRYHF